MMAQIGKPKTGRRASMNDRMQAQQWGELYRKAQKAPGGMLCLNPEDDPDLQTWLDGNDPEHLLQMLEHFARHGTFELVGLVHDSIRLLPLRVEYREMRAAGSTHEATVLKLAEKYALSTRTIERKVRTAKP
jgi:hypothetical protein